jgi:quercetin dioxygenase-like cupin family protein
LPAYPTLVPAARVIPGGPCSRAGDPLARLVTRGLLSFRGILDRADPDPKGRTLMLTRRAFTGFASCAIGGLAEFIATEASAQGAQPATSTPGVNRKILSKMDGPAPGYVTITAIAEIAAGAKVARHTHPGIEASYVLEGSFDLPIEGQGTISLKPGDSFQVPPNTPHAGGEPSKMDFKVFATYIVEKDKPLASPA